MATMVKEKRKDRKKTKEKVNPSTKTQSPQLASESASSNEPIITVSGNVASKSSTLHTCEMELASEYDNINICLDEDENTSIMNRYRIMPQSETLHEKSEHSNSLNDEVQVFEALNSKLSMKDNHRELLQDADNVVTISSQQTENMTEDHENDFTIVKPSAIYPPLDLVASVGNLSVEEPLNPNLAENIMPSAPMFETVPEVVQTSHLKEEVVKPKVVCIGLDELWLYCGGEEMAEVKAMSDKEEAIVEAGPMSGPEHPLVDLLSTFRSSLIALEGERLRITCGYVEEKKNQGNLWKIQKKTWVSSEKCPCGANVSYTASYDHAELLREKLPAAKLRLEGLLRDIQDSYCHHQHSALLAHCQIEELISETIQGNKREIREALSLVLQALRLSDSAPAALASALQRWATVLSAAVVDDGDLRHLLFLFHNLFRQSRSVLWASEVIQMSVESAGWARSIAVLDILLSSSRRDIAVPCTEDMDEAWEELDRHGSGAVSDGTLRERDLLALLKALPLSQIAGLPLVPSVEAAQAGEECWVDVLGGSRVGRACQHTRLLIATLQRGSDTHPNYGRLRAKLRAIARHTLRALALLHQQSRHGYRDSMLDMLAAELQACFVDGFKLFNGRELHKLPASLLSEYVAKDYCTTLINHLHDKSPRQVNSLGIELSQLCCDTRVRAATQAAVDRSDDNELASFVMKFLLQTIIKRKEVSKQCDGACLGGARTGLARLLHAHAHLCALALHQLADISQTDQVDPSVVKIVQVVKWRPNISDIQAILEDWSRRCPNLLQHLLLELDYTPYIGLVLDVQIYIGRWLCEFVRSPKSPTSSTEWAWAVLRRLRLHRTSWHIPPGDAPVAPAEPEDAFSIAYCLLYSMYGHCLPVICSEGVSLLCKLATTRPREAVHCLANIMLVLSYSPESIPLTPRFSELFNTLLNSGPTLVQRAFGRGGASGSELLLRLILAHLAEERCGEITRAALLTAWLYWLWQPWLPGAALALADAAALATRDWPLLDAYAARSLQEGNAKEHVDAVVRGAGSAPLLCECVLRAWHARREATAQCYPRLLQALAAQRAAGQRIHVDKAMLQVGATFSSDELCVYRSATAALSAPMDHPSHLTLWRLFMHLYLQRSTNNVSEPPVGFLFFSGIKKSRTLAQIKRRMQDTIVYHTTEIGTLKTQQESAKPAEKSTKNPTKSGLRKSPDDLLPSLSIVDLLGESQELEGWTESSDSEGGEEHEGGTKVEKTVSDSTDVKSLILYHESAVKLLREYLQWLEEGDQVRAFQHHEDIARYIPEQALEAAWRRTLCREKPAPSADLDEFPLPQFLTAPEPPPPKTPYRQAVDLLKRIGRRSTHGIRRKLLNSLEKDVAFTNSRSLTNLVDKHLVDIEKLAEGWYSDVSRVSELDEKLWQLLVKLRVPRRLPPIRLKCPNNCKPMTVCLPYQEWRLAVDVERAIEENRKAAQGSLRAVGRPRPWGALVAAALHTIARRLRSSEAAVRVAECAWRHAAARALARCAHAHALVTALVENLAERWICHDGKVVVELLSRWCRHSASPLQQALCGALVSPRRLPPDSVASLYVLLLNAKLPSHTAFSYLSKFELVRWCDPSDGSLRRSMLEALVSAVQQFGPTPESEHGVLVELFGVHTRALLCARELCAHVSRCARASAAGALPPPYWAHVAQAAEDCAGDVPMDQLGHLLRELGVIWWEARTSSIFPIYAPYIARLLLVIQRAFVASAMRLSYEPAMVSWYAWSGVREAWAPWVSPLPLVPLTERDHYSAVLRHFVDSLHQIMLDCPGSEIHLLQQTFEWCLESYKTAHGTSSTQDSRVQASALLVELAKLPWTEHQWFFGTCLQVAMQISNSTDKDLTAWCCTAWGDTTAETLLRDVGSELDADRQLAPKLATLLYLFTGTHLQHSPKILAEATRLPWRRLPEPALDEMLQTFFRVHHSLEQPYHDLPQFRVLLFASELCGHGAAHARHSVTSRGKRCAAVSHWVRVASAPELAHHVRGHSTCLLNVLTELAPFLKGSEGEIEELLSRAVVIMCMEPAGTEALPVWVEWVSRALVMAPACVSAAGALTVLQHFAPLADAAVTALLLAHESSGWGEVCARWATCAWREAAPLAARARMHAAYALALMDVHGADVKHTLPALLASHIHFIKEEVIVAVWICYACRVAREGAGAGEGAGTARALLAAWAEPQRRSLLKVVTMSADTDRPTARHRLLCRYALHILSPSEASSQAYEAACAATLGPSTDLAAWARAARPRRLPRLATRLFPHHEPYFRWELDAAPEETD